MKEIDLGCGTHKIKGSIGLDKNKNVNPDIVHDLDKFPYPFPNDYFDYIYMRHVLEHLEEPEKILKELLRIAKNATMLYIEIPHFSSYNAHLFNHKKTYSCQSFKVYCDENSNFELRKIELRWLRDVDTTNIIRRFVNRILSFLANFNYHICERVWCYWVGGFGEIRIWIRIKK